MKQYISILRGINVSGQKLIKMDALKQLYIAMGFANVQTYIQSGNVIFETPDTLATVLSENIHREIQQCFGFDVPVLVFETDQLAEVIAQNPFVVDSDKDTAYMHVTFLCSEPQLTNWQTVADRRGEGEEIACIAQAVYLYCPNGYGRTKLTNTFLESKLKVQATTRNWKTVNELLRIAQT